MAGKNKPMLHVQPKFHAHLVHPTMVHPLVIPPPSVMMLTHSPGVIHSAIKESPKTLVDAIRREARAHDAKGVCLDDPLGPGQLSALGAELAVISHDLVLAVTVRQTKVDDDQLLAVPPIKSGIKCVKWVDIQGELGPLSNRLKAFSKAGIWNHVVLADSDGHDFVEAVARFVVANPNIAHSWQLPVSPDSTRGDILKAMDAFHLTYSNYAPLPGRPFWQTLLDDKDMLLYLDQYGISRLSQWRISMDTQTLNNQTQDIQTQNIQTQNIQTQNIQTLDNQTLTRIGENLNYHFTQPQALSSDRLDEICQLVAAGGSVDTRWVKFNLKRAFLIAYVTEMDRVVADSSLKHPRPEYIATLNEKAGINLSDYLERGYTSVRPEYRGMGIGTRLLEGLTSRAQGRKIFSLIAEDNVATQKIALRNRTRKITTFFSHRAGKEMGVWMPEAMLK